MPSLQLKRSASLKSPRENIRRRHIDRERRKTCNPVLIRSPRSPEEEAEFEWRRHSTGETFSSSKSGSEETATSAETKQAVYRLMGEEIKLEEGIVRRQKEGNNMNNFEVLLSFLSEKVIVSFGWYKFTILHTQLVYVHTCSILTKSYSFESFVFKMINMGWIAKICHSESVFIGKLLS